MRLEVGFQYFREYQHFASRAKASPSGGGSKPRSPLTEGGFEPRTLRYNSITQIPLGCGPCLSCNCLRMAKRPMTENNFPIANCTHTGRQEGALPLCVTFRLVVVSLQGPGQSPVLPFACCIGSLLSVGRCGPCSCWCGFRVRGAQWLVCWGCAGCGSMCRLRISGAQ